MTALRVFCVLLFWISGASVALAGVQNRANTAVLVSEVRVVIDPVSGSGPDLTEMAKQLIGIRPFEPFSPQKVEKAVNYLKKSGRFQVIHADSDENAQGIVLIFNLAPFVLIHDIRLSGAYPLFEKTVFSAVTISAGDPYQGPEIETQRQAIEALYRREGFLAPVVTVKTRSTGKAGYVDLVFEIEPGRPFRLGRLDISGNAAVSAERLKLRMMTWRMRLFPGSGGRFSETDLKADLVGITQFYREKGYPEVSVRHTLYKNIETGQVVLGLEISEGPRYEVDFEGNQSASGRRLQKELTLKAEGNQALDRGLKKSVQNIERHYRESGFLDAKVHPVDQIQRERGSKDRRLTIAIEEGPRTLVQSVVISGNRFFTESQIREVMQTGATDALKSGIYRPDTLDADVQAIKERYLSQGFLNAKVDKRLVFNPDRTGVDIQIAITENVQTLVSETRISGEIPISDEEALGMTALSKGGPYRPYMLRSDENRLAEAIAEKGYPHVKVRATADVFDGGRLARIHYRVEPGPFVRMGSLWYRGNFRTRSETLDRALGLEPGEPFSLKKLLKGQNNIRGMGIFNSVRFNTLGLSEGDTEVHLLTQVEEAPPYFIELGAGYESKEGFFTKGKTGDRNLFGTDRSGWLGAFYSQVTRRVEGSLTDPNLFGSPFQGNLGAFWERIEEFNQPFGTEVTGASLSIKSHTFHNVTFGVKSQYEFRNLYLRGEEASDTDIDPELFDFRNLVVTSPTLQYDTRDSFIRPKKGLLSSIGWDISKGIEDTVDDFTRCRFDARYFWSPFTPLTLAWVGRTGWMAPFGANNAIPVDQLFYLGGTDDVRGFDENTLLKDAKGEALGGRRFFSGSMETRFDVTERYEMALFLDSGRILDTQGIDARTDVRYSAGIGLRYITPIGPIGLLYGWKLDPKPGESAGRFHFSVGYTF